MLRQGVAILLRKPGIREGGGLESKTSYGVWMLASFIEQRVEDANVSEKGDKLLQIFSVWGQTPEGMCYCLFS